MVLIRAMSNGQNTGLFSNNFREPIVVEPNSKMCLVNASLTMNNETITVDSTNKLIRVSLRSGGLVRDVTIVEGTYTQSNFVKALNVAFNSSIVFNYVNGVIGRMQGFRWLVALQNEKLSLNFNRNEVDFLQDNLKNMTVANDVLTAGANSGNTNFNCFSFSDSVATTGAGFIHANITNAGNDATLVNGIFGLLKEKPRASDTVLNSDKYVLGLRVAAGGGLFSIVDGVEKDSLLTIAADDKLIIVFQTGNVQFRIDEGGNQNSYNQFREETFEYTTNGYHAACSLRATGAKAQVQYFPDPFHSPSMVNASAVVPSLPLESTVHQAVSLTAVSASKVSVFFTDASRQLLGFDYLQDYRNLISGSFTARYSLPSSNVPSNISVEVPTFFTMKSFDGKSEQRRPIVSVIPSLNQVENRLVYDSHYPVWVALENEFAYSLSKLEVRLLDSDTDSELKLEDPGATLTLLIEKS